jgi:hypothetical protein
LPKFDDRDGIDPYADNGEVAPGEERKKKVKAEDPYAKIDQQIEEAAENGHIEKEVLLKRIKQYISLRDFTQNVSQNEAINLMIEKTQKEIEELDNQEYDEAEGEGEGEGVYYADGLDSDQYGSAHEDSKVSNLKGTLEERRDKGLREIFQIYAKSQMMVGRKATFEQIEHEISNLNLGEYMKFCKDFEIPCNKVKVAEIFKKIATNSKELLYDDFKNTLWKLFEARDKEEVEKLNKRLREIKKIAKKKTTAQPNVENKKIKESKMNEDISEIPSQRLETQPEHDEKSEVDSTKNKEDKKKDSSEPITISRPKGGDPKNVEVLQNLQRKDSDSDKDNKIEASKEENGKNENKDLPKSPEINKKLKGDMKNEKSDDEEKDDKIDHEDHDLKIPEEVNELQQERERILKRIEELEQPSNDEYQEEILEFLKCDNPKEYKKRSKTFMLPFNTRAKHEDTNNYRFKRKQNIDEIKQKVQQMKEMRNKNRNEDETKKNTQYKKHQNIMRKIHEDILRDKGIYIAPGMNSAIGHVGAGINSSAVGTNRTVGYKVPRKFTLESLGKMDYRQFIPPNGDVQDDNFKPSDVIDSDDEMDDDILELYQFNKTEEAYGLQMNANVNSASNLHPKYLSVNASQDMIGAMTAKSKAQNIVKNHLQSMPISRGNKRGGNARVNQSMLPPQKRKNAATEHRYASNTKNKTPAKKRGHSIAAYKNIITDLKKNKNKPKLYPNAYRSVKGAISDYSPNRKRNDKLKASNNKSLVRASDFDKKAKLKQEQKLRNILKLQNSKRGVI